jgi:hypothetical protein
MNARLLGLCVLILGFLTSCASPGGAARLGYTIVRPETSVSVETFRVTGVGFGGGWTMLWVQGDEFIYCIDQDHPEWVDTLHGSIAASESFAVFYQDGGGTTTGACSTGPVTDTYKVRVTGIEPLSPNLDLTQGRWVNPPTPTP